MNDWNAFDLALFSGMLVAIGCAIVGLLIRAGMITYRWYRDNNPRRMATRVRGLLRPSAAARRYMTPGSL